MKFTLTTVAIFAQWGVSGWPMCDILQKDRHLCRILSLSLAPCGIRELASFHVKWSCLSHMFDHMNWSCGLNAWVLLSWLIRNCGEESCPVWLVCRMNALIWLAWLTIICGVPKLSLVTTYRGKRMYPADYGGIDRQERWRKCRKRHHLKLIWKLSRKSYEKAGRRRELFFSGDWDQKRLLKRYCICHSKNNQYVGFWTLVMGIQWDSVKDKSETIGRSLAVAERLKQPNWDNWQKNVKLPIIVSNWVYA